LLDRDVAFALIKTEGLDETSRTRISREAQAMGRLGSHTHIVTVFDLGREQGQPYMVAELMVGGDVEHLIQKAPDHRVPLEQALAIARQTCRGLEFAHSRGVVHRDLKPSNIWLTDEGTAKIGDFGLAVALDRSRLTQEGMMVGTVAYMPPEQALGGEVTPRADLYSLGAMLYEMVTGRPPFLGDDPIAIIGQHINTQPVAPTWHNPQCPRPMEALILRLLAKDPAERPRSARDVLAALEAIDLSEAPLSERGDRGTSETHALDSLAGGVFVGRQQEMGELKAALEDALSGRGRLVTLVGEPGIGKTRTAQELGTYAGLRQCQVLWGRCYEGQGAPPYWPWVQAIRSYVQDRGADQLRPEMGAGAADIAEVVSEVRERLPGLEKPPALEPEQARFRLFDSITAFLKNAGRRQSLVLVLEDLHWADRPSLLLLEFVARELGGSRLLVIGTYRDVEVSRRHPLSQTLGELTRERLFQRVLLRGLSQGDVGRFIELVAGIAPPRGMVEAVYRQTEGNPLFVTEVVRLLVQEGALSARPEPSQPVRPEPVEGRGARGSTSSPRTGGQGSPRTESDSWTVRIPEGVREVIGRRLDRLSERCNQTLTIASVVGREFTLEQLKPLTDDPSAGSGQRLTEERLLEVLDEALGARVIEELPRSVGRYQFTHALIQETLAEELTTIRRVRLHARIAQALEALYGEQAEAHAAELAHHFAEAQAVLGTEKLVRYSMPAGERALVAYAWEEAQAHFELGLAAGGIPVTGMEPAKDAAAAALLFGLARVQAATLPLYQLREAVTTLSRAFDYYSAAGEVDRAVAVAEYPFPPTAGHNTGIAHLLGRALGLVPADSLQAARLLSRYGNVLALQEGDYDGAQQALARALETARREGDLELEIRTVLNAAEVDAYHERWPEALASGYRAIDLVPRVKDPRCEMLAHYWTMLSLLLMGEVEGAVRHGPATLEPAERLGQHFQLARALFANDVCARLTGDFLAARQFSDRGLGVSPREARLLLSRVLLEYEVGDFAQGEAYLERLLELMQLIAPGPAFELAFPAFVIPIVARITGAASRGDLARDTAEKILSWPSVTPLVANCARAGLGLLAVLRQDVVAAQEQYGALKLGRGTAITTLLGLQHTRLLGLLAQTMGNLDQAVVHFEGSLTFCRKAGYRPELAWTCCDYADCLLVRAGLKPAPTPGDRQKAMALLDEALAISRELGMRPLMERVLSRRQILTA
jgi:tetratricopeptide (TPR) repeat protein